MARKAMCVAFVGVVALWGAVARGGSLTVKGFQMPTGAAHGRVLTCDAAGLATWQTPPGGVGNDNDWAIAGNDIYSAVSGNVGIGTLTPAYKLDVAGTLQAAGFRMPTGAANGYLLTCDTTGVGTWRALPAHTHDDRYYTETELSTSGGGGQVHWDNLLGLPAGLADGDDDTTYGAGDGLSLVGTTFSADFAGTGSATTVSRSDHDHFGAALAGSAPVSGLSVTNSSGSAGASALYGSGSAAGGAGVYGSSSSSAGRGVYGYASNPSSAACGVRGHVESAGGADGWGGYFTGGMGLYGSRMAVGTTSPTAALDVSAPTGYNQVRMRESYTPTGTADTNGNTGDVAWDSNYIYIKTAAGWKRAALSSF